MTLREAFGIRGVFLRLFAFICSPILLVLVFLYWSFHAPIDFFLWFAVIFLPLLGYLAYVAMTMRFDNAVTVKSLNVSASMERVSNAVAAAIVINHWKLQDSNREKGCFRAKVGMTFQTWGQVFTVTVSKVTDVSSKVHMRCETIAQGIDFGKNDELVSKFQKQLENILM